MQCTKCQHIVMERAKFCPQCATPMLQEDDVKPREQINIHWIKGVFERYGYEIDEAKENGFLAIHPERAKLLVGYLPQLSLLTFQAIYSMKKPGWGQKGDFLSAVNNANTQNWLCSFFASENMDQVTVSSAMIACEQTSVADVASYIDIFTAGISTSIEKSGLLAFA